MPYGLNTTPKWFHETHLFFPIVDTHMAISPLIVDIMIKKLRSLYYIYINYTNIDGFEGGIMRHVLYRN